MTAYQRKGKKYSKITYKKRMQLIDLIVNKRASITETSKKLHVKLPTAKAILSSYRKKNHIFQRKKQTFVLGQDVQKEQKNPAIGLVQLQTQQNKNNIEESAGQQNINLFPNNYNYLFPVPYWNTEYNCFSYYIPQQFYY